VYLSVMQHGWGFSPKFDDIKYHARCWRALNAYSTLRFNITRQPVSTRVSQSREGLVILLIESMRMSIARPCHLPLNEIQSSKITTSIACRYAIDYRIRRWILTRIRDPAGRRRPSSEALFDLSKCHPSLLVPSGHHVRLRKDSG